MFQRRGKVTSLVHCSLARGSDPRMDDLAGKGQGREDRERGKDTDREGELAG